MGVLDTMTAVVYKVMIPFFSSADSRSIGGSETCLSRMRTLTLTPVSVTSFEGIGLVFERARRVSITFGILSPAERSALRTRTRPPCFIEGFARHDSVSMSKRKAMDPTRALNAFEDAKVGLLFRQVVYKPHDQLRRTNRSAGAYELKEGQ